MSRYWSDVVRRLTPYVPGEQPRHPRLVKLNTNESPYPPSPRVLDAIHRIDGDDLRRYPDPESTALRAAFAERAGLLPEQVFLGNGSRVHGAAAAGRTATFPGHQLQLLPGLV